MPPAVAYILSHHLPPLFDRSHRSLAPQRLYLSRSLTKLPWKCPVHKGVLDIADPGRNISKYKRSYLASPLNVASFLFLKRRFVFRG